ncbi:MAG: pyridoxamine 5'-phosphate oxidase family protein [Megasphaera cerevisiae]|nr:pyridoxamine 5'-phosphate oxidase family protein [Megasphaera cerevisiae]
MTNTLFIYDGDQVTRRVACIMASIVSMSRYAAYGDDISFEQYRRIIFVISTKKNMLSQMTRLQKQIAGQPVGLIAVGVEKVYMDEVSDLVQQKLNQGLDFTAFVSQEHYVNEAVAAAEKIVQKVSLQDVHDTAVFQAIEAFLLKHNTGVLATGWEGQVWSTPIEYMYYEGKIYMFSEGGKKFSNLYRNNQVSFSVFDPFIDFSHLAGLQIDGKARMIEPDDEEYALLAAAKGIAGNRLKKMPVILHIIEITPVQGVFLWAGFGKIKKAVRQIYCW